MDYVSLFDMPDWGAVALSAVQSVILYLLALTGLKLAGRRMFAEMGAQDLVVLLLVADASNLGLTHDGGGFWSSVASVVTVISLGVVLERIPVLHMLVEGRPLTLYDNGRLNRRCMDKCKVEMGELDEVARKYGLAHYTAFQRIVIEADGTLTGTVRHHRAVRHTGKD